MLLETLLAYLHISAVLGLVVFLTAKVALLRPEVLAGRPQLLRRVLRMDNWCWAAFAAVAASGALRVLLGVKGAGWYASNPLLWVKLALFALMLAMGLPSRSALLRWRDQAEAPTPEAIRSQRRWLMWQAHILVLLPLFGALLAYGY
jgi:putative membrane protein